MTSLPLAPMGSLFKLLTAVLLTVPVGMLAAVALNGANFILVYAAAAMLAVYAFVYLYLRPQRFEIDDDELHVVFPIRRISVPRSSIRSAEVVDWREFSRRYPRPIRVGAGGLWGGFGRLVTRGGWVQFYISRQEDMILFELLGRMPLLISPDRPTELIKALK